MDALHFDFAEGFPTHEHANTKSYPEQYEEEEEEKEEKNLARGVWLEFNIT